MLMKHSLPNGEVIMQDVAAACDQAVLEELWIVIYISPSPTAFFADPRNLSLSIHRLNSFLEKSRRPLHRLLFFGVAQFSRWRRQSTTL